MARSIDRSVEPGLPRSAAVAEQLWPLARSLRHEADLDPLLERIGDARFVLLGEASHGTAEFYAWRTLLSQRLIREKGFRFLAVEGDWPDCHRLHRYIQGRSPHPSARAVLQGFDRWPTWMWANTEVVALAEWLRLHNASQPPERRVGFFGLDLYSLWDSMAAVLHYLERMDPPLAQQARRAYDCFAPYAHDAQRYARATALMPFSCEPSMAAVLHALQRRADEFSGDDPEAYFVAEQNARVAQHAERYYRAMVQGGPHSWNVRDAHMLDTLERLRAFYGPEARAIVWAHNTHIGDARYTDMAERGEFNLGQLVRERHGDEGVVLVGFSTHRGTVIAGEEWDAPMESMEVPPARAGSVEDVLHFLGSDDKLLLFSDDDARGALLEPRGHRAIGVVYDPRFERYGNYVPTVLPRRYDALLYLDVTQALEPLPLLERPEIEAPETWPSGV
jgi:erythromycin esterase-like protein